MTDQQIVTGPGDIAEDSGVLGLNVYAGTIEGSVVTAFASSDLGQGPGALAWLTGDFFGSGRAQIAQPWDANGSLGLNVYSAGSTVAPAFVSSDLGQGSGALAWLTGNFFGLGSTQIAQPWKNLG